jgi:hypothetical protein
MMADEPLQLGDFVEIVAAAERPPGQPAPARRFGRVMEPADDNGRAAIQVEGRQYPLWVPVQQLRRVAH